MPPRPVRLRLAATIVAAAMLATVSPSAPTAAAQAAPPSRSTARADHVVLVSIDGFRPDFYRDRATWGAPTLRQMARAGVHALGVRSVFPSVTYPAHTTLVTGALPARHGIYYNAPFEPAGQTGRWYWEADTIRVPTLFSALRAAGRTSAAISWPVTVGAPVDWLLPEVWPLDPTIDRLEPMLRLATPGLVPELEREAIGRIVRERNFNSDDLTRDDRFGAIAAYLLETKKPALLAVHLIGTDHFQHDEGRSGPTVERAVAAADRAVAAIVEAAARAGILERTAFVVTGDHGFVDTHARVDPNVWLARAGLRDSTSDRGDWRATFHTSGAAAFLHLRDPADTAAVAIARRAIAEAPAAARRLFRVVAPDELRAIGADPRVSFALTAANGARLGGSATAPAVKPSRGGTHGYFPTDFPEIHTGFIGWGAGFREEVVAPMLGLEDVAPTIAALLGVPFAAPDGLVLSGLLTTGEP